MVVEDEVVEDEAVEDEAVESGPVAGKTCTTYSCCSIASVAGTWDHTQELAASSLGSWDTSVAALVAVAGCSGGDLLAVQCWRDSQEQTDLHSNSAPFPGYWTEGQPVEA